jgi:hypothetical protein
MHGSPKAFGILVILIAAFMSGCLSAESESLPTPDPEPEALPISVNKTFSDTIPAGAKVNGLIKPRTWRAFSYEIQAPNGTGNATATLSWTKGDTGVEQMVFAVDIGEGNFYSRVDSKTGSSKLELKLTGEMLSEAKLRFVVEPNSAAWTDQAFSILVQLRN